MSKKYFITRRPRPASSQPDPPAATSAAAPDAARSLLATLRRGPDPDFDPEKEFDDFLADLAKSPPIEEIRAEEIQAMTEVANYLLADWGRRLVAAELQGDNEVAEKARQMIHDLDQGRSRWADYYRSDEFAEAVGTAWAGHIRENAATWRRESREALEAARAQWQQVREFWERGSPRPGAAERIVGEDALEKFSKRVAAEVAAEMRRAGGEPRQDDSAWVPISKVWPSEFDSYKACTTFLEGHPGLRRRRPISQRTGKPNPQRLEVHAGDWATFCARRHSVTFEALGSQVEQAEALEEGEVSHGVALDEHLFADFLQGVQKRTKAARGKKDDAQVGNSPEK